MKWKGLWWLRRICESESASFEGSSLGRSRRILSAATASLWAAERDDKTLRQPERKTEGVWKLPSSLGAIEFNVICSRC